MADVHTTENKEKRKPERKKLKVYFKDFENAY